MSFQSCLDNVEKKNGKKLIDLKVIATEKRFLVDDKLTEKQLKLLPG
jgi:hypothetical protein